MVSVADEMRRITQAAITREEEAQKQIADQVSLEREKRRERITQSLDPSFGYIAELLGRIRYNASVGANSFSEATPLLDVVTLAALDYEDAMFYAGEVVRKLRRGDMGFKVDSEVIAPTKGGVGCGSYHHKLTVSW